ncbi:kinase-associated lipoprotein B [Bacillus sp. PS06]|uniref:kinase-associated lipoprotein B n=1 Tax=Bacillus sp. PS06 TaxID=2764176 RepID=UPI001785FE31|nr:kinase-associated lipoprotein B [Bacillus sp. PS06]MBD8070498.1 kinase-associated lipoprotein B [Bacillus sp. PS06]
MTIEELQVGDTVTGIYKTGKYIGEITAIRPQHYLVKVKAVLKHPMQGDLHHPKEAEVPFFHERKALAHHEQTNIPKAMVKKYNGEIIPYEQSLRDALTTLTNELSTQQTLWAERSLENVRTLEKEYFK